MGSSRDRLAARPDDPSCGRRAPRQRNGPAESRWLHTRSGAGPALNSDEGADMAEVTRPLGEAHSRLGDSSVKITPLAGAALAAVGDGSPVPAPPQTPARTAPGIETTPQEGDRLT